MNLNTALHTVFGDTIDVEMHATDVELALGNELGEDVRRTRLAVADIDSLIHLLTVRRDQVAAEVERRNARAARILADLGLDAEAARGAIAEGFINPGTVIDRRAAVDRDDASQTWQSA